MRAVAALKNSQSHRLSTSAGPASPAPRSSMKAWPVAVASREVTDQEDPIHTLHLERQGVYKHLRKLFAPVE